MSKPPSSSSSLLVFLIIITVTLGSVAGETLAADEDPASYISNNSDDKNENACDEIYVVKEGETLQTISDKCNDPFILEENTQIKDFDDVFPGLVIKITSLKKSRKLLKLL